MRALSTFATMAVVFGGAARAMASPSAKLVYVRGPGTETCPPEADLRKAVAVRLGYDPFFPSAQKTVVAEVARAPAGYRGKVRIVADDGTVRGERELATKGEDCGELTSAIALAVSIALDDLDEPAPKAPPASSTTTAPVPDEPPPPAPPNDPKEPPAQRDVIPRKPVASDTADLALTLGPTISIGTAPNAAPGLSLGAALRWTRFALRLDARAELRSSTGIAPTGQVGTNLGVAMPSFCVRFGLPFACAGVGPAIVWSRTESIARPANDRAFVLLAALRLGVDVPLGSRIYLEPLLELGANFLPHVVKVDGVSVHEMSPVWGTLGIHIGGKIL